MASLHRLRVLRSHDGEVPLQGIDGCVRQNGYSILATFAIADKEQAEMAAHPLRIHAA